MNIKLILGIAAAVALSACSNDELLTTKPNNTEAIAFDSFVNKADMTSRSTEDITNDNLGSFTVYGYTNVDDAVTDPDITTNSGEGWYILFDNAKVKRDGTDSSGNALWTYTNIQYWKDDAKYHFHAIAPRENAQWSYDVDGANPAKATLSFTNISDTADGTQDLLYSYQKATGQKKGNGAVQFNFSHLLSRVKFRFEGAETNPSTVTIAIDSVSIYDTYDKGTITLENTVASTNSILADFNWQYSGDAKSTLSFGPTTETFTTGKAETDHKYMLPVSDKAQVYHAKIAYKLTATVNSATSHIYNITQDIELPSIAMKKGFSYVYVLSVKTGTTGNSIIEPIIFNASVEEWNTPYTELKN
jgi:hypothetical protein